MRAKSKILVTQAIDTAGLDILRDSGHQLVLREGEEPITPSCLHRLIGDCRALWPMPSDSVDKELLDAAPLLEVVGNHAVGVDNIDLAAARRRKIVVCNTPGVLTEATAEMCFALMLAAARRILEGDRMMRRQLFRGWRPTMLRGVQLHGSTLGIIGRGRIGNAVAERARAFGMRVVHHNKSSGVPLAELLQSSDVVSLHCPLTDQTRHLIAEPELRQMKPTAVLVNTARGPVVDEAALARALREGWIAAAGLDVFEDEPRAHTDLLGLDNVVLAPHLGSATHVARRRMAELAARNILAVLDGQQPPHPVL